jgi:hypothetical protein
VGLRFYVVMGARVWDEVSVHEGDVVRAGVVKGHVSEEIHRVDALLRQRERRARNVNGGHDVEVNIGRLVDDVGSLLLWVVAVQGYRRRPPPGRNCLKEGPNSPGCELGDPGHVACVLKHELETGCAHTQFFFER